MRVFAVHTQSTESTKTVVTSCNKHLYNCKNIPYTLAVFNKQPVKVLYMNKANTRELNKALAWLDTGNTDAIDVACRTLATIQRAGTASDTKAILAIIKDKGLSHKFYTENHCLMAID